MRVAIPIVILLSFTTLAAGQPAAAPEYRLLATNRTSTMEREMNQAADAGFVFAAFMGGETAFGGSEAVVIMLREDPASRRSYRLLATSKTSTMAKEMREIGEQGYEYRGQSVYPTAARGSEVLVIFERDLTHPPAKIEYHLLATSRTSTMEKELRDAALAGFRLLGMTVGKTAFGGEEVVSILRRR